MEFSGIGIVTKDVAKMREFYTKVLDVEADGDDTHVNLHTKGGNITIFSVEGMEEMAPGSMRGAGTGSFTISFEVDDVDTEYERLKELGVELVKLPKTYPWGTRSVWFRDTDGNIVNFYCWVEK